MEEAVIPGHIYCPNLLVFQNSERGKKKTGNKTVILLIFLCIVKYTSKTIRKYLRQNTIFQIKEMVITLLKMKLLQNKGVRSK